MEITILILNIHGPFSSLTRSEKLNKLECMDLKEADKDKVWIVH